MEGGKLIAICQFGGEFVTDAEGTMSYTGGEAHAIQISHGMPFNNFKSEIANMFNIDSSCMSIRYFLPYNKRTPITISSDKDLERMIDFNLSYMTTDIYVSAKVDNRPTRSAIADSGTSMVDTAAAEHNARIKRVAASKKTRNRVTRASNPIADNVRAPEPDAAKLTPERAVCNIADSVNLATVDVVDHCEPQFSKTPWDNAITDVGQEFDNPKAFRDELRKYAYVKGFKYKYIKNDNARVTVKCSEENCSWRIHASGSTRKQRFIIKKINKMHTCDAGNVKAGYGRRTKQWLTSIVKETLLGNPDSKPKDIAIDLYQDFGINLSYSQAWHLKEFAQKDIHKLQEELSNRLPWFCQQLVETNPGSIALILSSANSMVRRLFVSFHAFLHGFKHGCRPLLFLDRIPLKANNQWKLLVAAAVDGNDEILPVAFGLVEAETCASWQWFLEQLKCALDSCGNLTIISSRKMGLDESVPQVFQDCFHSYSLSHLMEEFKTQINNGSSPEEMKDAMVEAFKGAAQTSVLDYFTTCIEKISTISKDAGDWVISTKPSHWSDALFKGIRYGYFSSNIAEFFSTFLEVKDESSVVQIIDTLMVKLIILIDSRRQACNSWEGTMTPSTEKKLEKEMYKVHTLNVVRSSDAMFEVRGSTSEVVDIESWECTCRKWQITRLPCVHAIAVIDHSGKSVYDYCSQYYTTACYSMTYSASINRVPDIENIISSQGPTSYPPPSSRPPGRPKRKRISPYKTSTRPLHCSRCKQPGHNKATCNAQL
ncbi:uncharacterized protein LOC120261340 [Dioscorea cayenensis subsp. rotundata]|uniref:Uncharacterized protein LOC120261340 n=1 Tax=Dioscorea cayennensis subsp. rotundata TaxID=55577 RepID=A0AB40BEZ3_DIOCR|nr:uncharacterized protein LOC120261340 [Dioscorea cayenensis subsp. rotundata]